mmetsp:Transcript_28347/g.39159  ORF Transcript_28347/g.39159 Transcript_28347/m.39159 type:complete len:257 (-) Transcript_28347:186-956(-)|eukprot:CAMPEP_0196570764 /NCGR_PEP_ID=MMETSP1081-20130531/897_1 /TAXON_ID=36882 /ORGANISM="Pyramimonas amylifera, Strain CCMP720" /LENGTH=256 /DNA_ID=CAMNT_0041887389 /DNA_START=140 /DNA_END=910 /DNA_ORIENTATION=-
MASMTASSVAVRSSFVGKAVQAKSQSKAAPKVSAVRCQAESQDVTLATRRGAMTAFSAAALAVSAKPSLAAYGEGANVFGAATQNTEFIPYAGDGFAVLVPSKFNPSKEKEFEGTVMRYEDNGDAVTYLLTTITPTDKTSITQYGTPAEFLSSVSFLLGRTTQTFITGSEGGFGANRVAAASLLGAESVTKKGKTYYEVDCVTRTADGNEGGRHHLISGTVSNGKLYLFTVQIGDKRWFKGMDRPCTAAWKSFTVA